ncbi:hypothetical protein RND71_013876 [Anisodus tanguticus]|uniref:Chitin-binding type-1 domain-containing protein n=1 Tax=Anisodus tanguticus TaxID=243964 RepID=A0AAE1VJF2_9SOLA|nr:hypothetical protein RND71_013876 [Anisodus tanguticus]
MINSFSSRKHLIFIYTIAIVLISKLILARAEGLCCSKWGYCGTGNDYCGKGCQGGPCFTTATNNTNKLLQAVIPQELHFLKLSNLILHLQLLLLLMIPSVRLPLSLLMNYCDEQNIEYPCVSGKKYYGRGPIQLSWNFNYGPAGKDIGFDGLNDLDIVARDNMISFKTALWYWMNTCHSLITSGLGFGATIRAIYGPLECDGGNPPAVDRRIDYYTEYCYQLGVETGNNTTC